MGPDDVLAPLRQAPSRAGVFVDFDGTLSPIVLDPATAAPLPGVGEVLLELEGTYGVVAVVSGRPVSYLARHLPPGLRLCGLYGLEQVIDGEVALLEDAEAWRSVVDEVAERAGREGPGGLEVEHKGLSLTLHYRRREEIGGAVLVWAEEVARTSGLLVRPAKMSVELHPPVAVDKGTVLDQLVVGLDAACFVGDDTGDLPAFDALDRFAARGGTSVRVAVRTSELAADLARRADLVVDGPAGTLALLRSLVVGA